MSTPDSIPSGEFGCLLAKAGGEHFALLAARIVRVLRDVTIHPIPGAGPPVVGLAQYAGEPVAVVDLFESIHGRSSETVQQIVVLIARERRTRRDVVGLAVDETIRLERIRDVSIDGHPEPPVLGWTDISGNRVRVVDPTQIAGVDPDPSTTSWGGET